MPQNSVCLKIAFFLVWVSGARGLATPHQRLGVSAPVPAPKGAPAPRSAGLGVGSVEGADLLRRAVRAATRRYGCGGRCSEAPGPLHFEPIDTDPLGSGYRPDRVTVVRRVATAPTPHSARSALPPRTLRTPRRQCSAPSAMETGRSLCRSLPRSPNLLKQQLFNLQAAKPPAAFMGASPDRPGDLIHPCGSQDDPGRLLTATWALLRTESLKTFHPNHHHTSLREPSSS